MKTLTTYQKVLIVLAVVNAIALLAVQFYNF